MRICAFLVSLAVLAAPMAHAAQQTRARPATPVKSPTGLRGSVTAATAPPGAAPGARSGLGRGVIPPAPQPLASAAPNAGQCRTGCAHSYYFCLSEPTTTDCAPTWSQCLTDCAHPPLTLGR